MAPAEIQPADGPVDQRYALLSVSDKTGIETFAAELLTLGNYHLISSGGTAATLEKAGIPVTRIEQVTGSPEMLGGRVKTLHPKIHGGILADLRNPAHSQDLQAQGITPIDIVVVNLYPFQQTVAQEGVTLPQAVEQIDIGGVALLRAAAKNWERVIPVCDPADYPSIIDELRASGSLSLERRRQMAIKAFNLTSRYDAAIAAYLEKEEDQIFPS